MLFNREMILQSAAAALSVTAVTLCLSGCSSDSNSTASTPTQTDSLSGTWNVVLGPQTFDTCRGSAVLPGETWTVAQVANSLGVGMVPNRCDSQTTEGCFVINGTSSPELGTAGAAGSPNSGAGGAAGGIPNGAAGSTNRTAVTTFICDNPPTQCEVTVEKVEASPAGATEYCLTRTTTTTKVSFDGATFTGTRTIFTEVVGGPGCSGGCGIGVVLSGTKS